ncbi:MAG: AzlD domain-containing protein [Candidatus Sedimenticola sp. (ex Thyasira tokunagai)]
MSGVGYLLAVIGVMTLMTFLTRVLPFIALKNRGDHPLLLFLGRYTPPVIMTILLLYSLKAVDLTRTPHGANELSALLLTAGLHLWRGNPLLSIFSGTALYMVLIQQGFF